MRVETLCAASGQPLLGPLLLRPELFGDTRGFLFESWNQRHWQQLLAKQGQLADRFVQDNHSRSRRGVLRGLHYQLPPHAQAKLVRCVRGEIFDVGVDLRPQSPTYRQWVGVYLSDQNHCQLWLPQGFAHGFLTLSEQAEVLYKASDFWHRESERSIRWSDPQLQIAWPLQDLEGQDPLVSDKDACAPALAEAARALEGFV